MTKDNEESKELSLNTNIDFYYQGAHYKSWIILGIRGLCLRLLS
ncbi:MAG: hypothetical protein ACJA2G_000489 [Cognaticolwellia sp.]|jgi:hypothetical protein